MFKKLRERKKQKMFEELFNENRMLKEENEHLKAKNYQLYIESSMKFKKGVAATCDILEAIDLGLNEDAVKAIYELRRELDIIRRKFGVR